MTKEQNAMMTDQDNLDEESKIENAQKDEKEVLSDESEKDIKDMDFDDKLSEYLEKQSDKNNVYIQYRVYNNHGVMAGDDANFENISFKTSEVFHRKNTEGSVFWDRNVMRQWLSDNYESYAMALMIATAVFDSFPDTWVVQSSERLFETFEGKKEMERDFVMEEILDQFEAEICKGEINTYTGKIDVNIICLAKAEYQEQILKYIWQQFPQLQEKIIEWLQNYTVRSPVSMSKRAIETMGKLACWDYYFFLNKMIPQIASDKSILTDMMIGQILIILNQKERYQNNIYHLLYSWRREKTIHYLLTTIYVCAQLQDKNDILKDVIDCYIQEALKEIGEGRASEYQLELYDFLGVGIRSYTFYRILIEQLYGRISAVASVREKRDIYGLFLKLFAIDIKQSRPEKGDDVVLIKLCMISHAAVDQLCYIWQLVWQSNYYRKALYNLMVQYDKKICKANSQYCIEKFLNRTLKNIYTKEMRNDICYKIHRRAGNE